MKRLIGILAFTAGWLGAQSRERVSEIGGRELFIAHCASCHGKDAAGGGPAAVALKSKMPDLTLLARANKGKFPRERVERSILGNDATPAHGSKEMPVWGPAFAEVSWDRDLSRVRIKNVLDFLARLQRQ